MKVASWNVNGIRSCWEKGLHEFIKIQNPDVFCIQEAKAFDTQCEAILKTLGTYKFCWHAAERPGYSGVVTFYRGAPLRIHQGMGLSKYDREGRVVGLEFEDWILLNLYFPNGAQSEERHFYKMGFLEDVFHYFLKLDRNKPLILAGDFNIAHQAIDIHDPIRLDGTSGFKPEERDWMGRLFKSGFEDVYRRRNPQAKDQYTWWSYRQVSRKRNKGWRIDYLVLSERLSKKVKKIHLHQEILGSDHCPLSLEIDI